VQDADSRPATSTALLSPSTALLAPRPSTSRTNSDESRSARSGDSGRRGSIRGMVNRLRSSSSASSLGGKMQEVDFSDIHDWFGGFQNYNRLVATKYSLNESYDYLDFAKATKPLVKNCGGRLLHSIPESAFDFGLLWCPAGKLSRRESEEPSWSWTAFSGPVNFPFDPTTCPDAYRAPRSEGELFRSEIIQYHTGPTDAPYTVRREKDGSLRTKYPPYFHAPRGHDASAESSTLRFTASAISAEGFTAEQLHYQAREIPCSQLINKKAQHCGVIMDFESSISKPSTTGPFEFVLLSRNLRRAPDDNTRRPANPTMHPPGTPIWDGEHFVWDEQVVDHDDEVFADGPWKMLNVMLIKWVGEHAERVAIARIHEDAWMQQGPVKKEIVLR
jgi:hypothetical protein